MERTKTSALNDADHEKLSSAVQTLAILTQEIERKGTTIRRLRGMVFGLTSEKTKKVLGDEGDVGAATEQAKNEEATASQEKKAAKKVKGHGRNPVEDYRGAEQIFVRHEKFCTKDACPLCR